MCSRRPASVESLENRVLLTYTLQILHASDLEGGLEALDRAANFAAVVEALEDDAASQGISSVLISAGDNYIPGPIFSAAGDGALRSDLQAAYQALFNEPGLTNIREGDGRIDITIMNLLEFDAAAVGNHEFDAGPNTFAGLLETDIRGGSLGDVRWLGTQFPYLSANLDFSADGDLAPLFTSDILPNTAFASTPDDLVAAAAAPKLAPATVIERDGELIGVVGATTQLLNTLSSTGDVSVIGPTANDMPALAAILQPVIDDVINGADNVLGTADDVDKIVLASHLQQIALEQQLTGLLSGVDVVIAGGSDTLLADGNDRLRAGDTADATYPVVTTNADGDTAVVVSTDGEYSYVGRLIVEFDAAGRVIPSSVVPETAADANVNGAYATDEQGVLDVTGAVDIAAAIAASPKATEVQKLTDAVETIVTTQDGNVFGQTDVYLDGRRSEVRTEETNLGNLTADANLFVANQYAAANGQAPVLVSLKNGGGIRAAIGEIDGGTGDFLAPQANPASGKLEGEISELDIKNSLRFNNGLTVLTVSARELELLFEHGVAATGPGNTPGQFAQVGGAEFSVDPNGTPVEFDANANVVTDGTRIRNLTIVDENGEVIDVIAKDGQLVGDPERPIRIVTLDFLFGIFSSSAFIGGDGYPFPAFAQDVVQLRSAGLPTGVADFTSPGTEQDAFAEFLATNFPADTLDPANLNPSFAGAETEPALDTRIQDVTVRTDTILDGVIVGTEGNDILFGTSGDDRIFGFGGNDIIFGLWGDDTIFAGAGNDLVFGGFGNDDIDGGLGNDILLGGFGNDGLFGGPGFDFLWGGPGADTIDFTGSLLDALWADGDLDWMYV